MITLLGGFALLIAGALFFSSCEGPAGTNGTNGSDGSDGTDGTDGIDGKDGADGSATCILCHSDDQNILTKTRQYDNSAHAMGHTSGYTNRSFGPSYNCAACHTSQGYLENLVGASNVPYANVTQPNCYTCHKIHDTYTEADWALQQEGTLEPNTGSPGMDLGAGNQCVGCHQFATLYLENEALWANFDDGGNTSVEITAGEKRAGVHHAPQYNLFAGMDLFEFTGSSAYPSDSHVAGKTEDGCVTCHMNDGFGDLTGHSMSMTWEFHGSDNYNWPASCLDCHTSGGDNDIDAKFEEVKAGTDALLEQLYTILVDAGIMYPADTPGNAYLMMPGTFTTNLTAAHVNYNAIREDKSHGFHNAGYITAILDNTIESLTPAK